MFRSPSLDMSKDQIGPEDFNFDNWEDEKIGADWDLKPPENEPLIRDQQMDQFVHLRSEILSDVIFFEKLGQGSFGKVWKVTAKLNVRDPNEQNSDPVWTQFTLACKILHHMWGSIREVTNTLNEAKMLKSLRHENICNLAEVIGIPDRETNFPYSVVCIFYEICDGDISKLIREHRELTGDPRAVLPEKLSRHWFAQIALALEYIHDKNVVHRDLEQPNILYKYGQSSGNGFDELFMSSLFKLTDFGLAMDLASKPQAEIDGLKRVDVFNLSKLLSTTGRSQDNQISAYMIDLLGQMRRAQVTALQILNHPWLQNNDEIQTERFILRTHRVTQPYNAWLF